MEQQQMRLRKAEISELQVIWKIFQQAIEQRRRDGSSQWQDGYPNEQSIRSDIENSYGYVLCDRENIIAYSAIIFDGEPAYDVIEGQWATDGDYVVVHRVAVSDAAKGKGIATRLFGMIEELAVANGVYSIKVDTNFDNVPMLKILDRLRYIYCGEVFFRGSARKAFEKLLSREQ
ncbi:GNAT family N-acetyltransferase [Pedobacter sp. JY14-1]|uniref:GNAT family N-acetyltransferase n=1 Tax=Pedobacter sp. JY14-1 TaxID=3034151 RepID=UPI0023E21474|nr:GNAT family N-acetyltransferase [Pedobacter sp. JY14-1]